MPAAEICEANKVYEVRVVARVSLLYMVIGGHNLRFTQDVRVCFHLSSIYLSRKRLQTKKLRRPLQYSYCTLADSKAQARGAHAAPRAFACCELCTGTCLRDSSALVFRSNTPFCVII